MNANEHFTGERFLPGVAGEIAYEHCHRYAFARRFVRGARVLDAACGEGYGTALLADVAASVVGIDIEPQVVADATRRYASSRANVRFAAASVTRLPLADASVDAIVSFETIEHVGADDQRARLAEFARVCDVEDADACIDRILAAAEKVLASARGLLEDVPDLARAIRRRLESLG